MQREPGTYRGTVVETTVGKTKKGYPQFIVRIQPEEVYDFTDQEWYAVDQTNQLPDIGYLVLCTATQEMFHLQDIRAAFGWQGTTFKSLAEASFAGTKVQYRMAENDYDGKVTIQMQNVAAFDASPTGGLRAASDDDLKTMDAEFGGFLKNSAAKAPAAAPKPPTAPKPPKAPKATKPAAAPEAPAEPEDAPPPVVKTPPKPKALSTTPPGAAPAVEAPSAPDKSAIFEKIMAGLPEVTDADTCWAAIKTVAEQYQAEAPNVELWWADHNKQYPGDWTTIRNEVVREIADTYIPF